jgi:hypothetical protein
MNKKLVPGGVLVVLMMLACAGSGNKGGQTAAGPPAKIGEEVSFKDSKWTVLDAKDMGKTLKSNNQFQKDATTDGRFIQVHFKVTNTTNKEDRLVDLPKLIDSQSREYKHIDRQTFYLPEGGKAMGGALPASITK